MLEAVKIAFLLIVTVVNASSSAIFPRLFFFHGNELKAKRNVWIIENLKDSKVPNILITTAPSDPRIMSSINAEKDLGQSWSQIKVWHLAPEESQVAMQEVKVIPYARKSKLQPITRIITSYNNHNVKHMNKMNNITIQQSFDINPYPIRVIFCLFIVITSPGKCASQTPLHLEYRNHQYHPIYSSPCKRNRQNI